MGSDFSSSFTRCVGKEEERYLLQLLAAGFIVIEDRHTVGTFNVLISQDLSPSSLGIILLCEPTTFIICRKLLRCHVYLLLGNFLSKTSINAYGICSELQNAKHQIHLSLRKESPGLDTIEGRRDRGHYPLVSSKQPFQLGNTSNIPNQSVETYTVILLQATHSVKVLVVMLPEATQCGYTDFLDS